MQRASHSVGAGGMESCVVGEVDGVEHSPLWEWDQVIIPDSCRGEQPGRDGAWQTGSPLAAARREGPGLPSPSLPARCKTN